MKAFASALVFYVVLLALTGMAFEYAFSLSSTDAYSLDSVRVEQHLPLEHRTGWADGE